MKIVMLGNFEAPYSSECHHASTLEALGHEVIRLQEGEQGARVLAAARFADLFVWVHSHGRPPSQGIPINTVLTQIQASHVPTCTYHLDLYVGIPERFEEYREHPYMTHLDHFFSVDPPLVEHINNDWRTKTRAHYLTPGVLESECYLADPGPRIYPVSFVGSRDYHAGWPYRRQLIDWLKFEYPDKFTGFGPNFGKVVRGHELNRVYASTKVVVGDSYSPHFDYPGYWCVDEGTQILTTRGWLTYDEVNVGDFAYTLNRRTGEAEWLKITAVNIFPSESRKMLSLESASHSSLTTLDHRWIVRVQGSDRIGPAIIGGHISPVTTSRYGYTWRMKTSRELKTNDCAPISARCSTFPDQTFADELVELVAWAWTEGSSTSGYYSSISQSHSVNAPYVERIRSALTKLYGPPRETLLSARHLKAWREWRPGGGETRFALNNQIGKELWRYAPNKKVSPEFICQLTEYQLRLFVETSLDADGCRAKYRDPSSNRSPIVTISQKDGSRLDGFQMACALLGIPTSGYVSDNDKYAIHVKKRNYVQLTRNARLVDHNGRVWCPTTANGTWLARRNGKVFFTGNSDRIPETLGRGGFLIHPWIEGIDDFYTDREHLVFYDYGDFDQLRELIDYYLEHDDEREAIRHAGHRHVKDNHTFTHRWEHILETVNDRV